MFYLVAILYDLYMENRRAEKVAEQFEEFVVKTRKDVCEDEEGHEDERQAEEVKSKAEKSGWREAIRRGCRRCRKRTASLVKGIGSCCRYLLELAKNGRWRRSKRLVALLSLLGVFLMIQAVGTLFYFVIALKFSTRALSTGTFVGVCAQTVLFLILLSSHLRAIFLVTLPSLIGSRLRTILVITMLIWAFQFPAQNVTSNVQSTLEGVNCVSMRVKAAINEVKDRAGHTFRDAPLEQMRQFMKDQAKPFDEIRKTMRNMDDSLEKMLDWQRELIGKIHNLMQNCSHMAQLPLKACVGWLHEQHLACQERFFEMVCKPIHLVKGLCYLTKVLELNCEWPSRVKSSVKEGVTHFVKGAQQKATDFAKRTFLYDIYNKTKEGKEAFESLELTIDHEQNYTEEFRLDKERIQDEMRNEIAAFERFLDLIVLFLDLLMVAMTLWPLFLAVLYIKHFKKSESTDNHYIDDMFESIDRARALNGQFALLPLLPKEKKQFIRTFSLRTTSKERLLMCVQHVFLFFSVLPIAVFILIDIFVYKLLRRAFVFFHGDVTIFPMPSIYKLKVSGDGILNQLLANILHTFEPLTDAKQRDQLWRQCFVEPSPPNYELFQIIFLIYIFCAVLIQLQTYLKRTRHLIALYFFPDRARPRALFLYNKVLGRRMQLWDMVGDIKKDKDKHKDPEEGDKEKQLLLKGLGVLVGDKQQCSRCARTDLSLEEMSNIRLCVRCHAIYCTGCFLARQRCLREDCRAPLQAMTEDVELYADSSCDDEEDDKCYAEEKEERKEIEKLIKIRDHVRRK